MHGFALTIYHPAVGADILVRRTALVYHGGQQTGLEPAPVLIRTFQVQVTGRVQLVIFIQYGSVGYAAVEPHVHNVVFFFKFLAAACAGNGCRNEIAEGTGVPCIRAFLPEQLGNSFNGFVRDNGLTAVLAVDHRDGHAPGTLTGNTPVAPVTHHALDTLLTPCGNPVHAFNCLDGFILKAIHRAEPLLRCPVDDGAVATPAVGVLVHDVRTGKHRTGLYQPCRNGFVCFCGIQSGKFTSFCGLTTLVVHADQNADLVIILADLKVLHAVARCRVDASGTAFQCHMIPHDDHGIPVIQRVLGLHIFQLAALEGADGFIFRNARSLHGLRHKLLRHYIIFVVGMHQGISILRSHADRQVARDRPGGGGPDHEIDVPGDAGCRKHALVIRNTELHINRLARIVLVLDLRLCQRRIAIRAPIYRLKTLVHVPVLRHLAEHLHLPCLILRAQGQIGVIVVSKTAQTLELRHLIVHMLHGIVRTRKLFKCFRGCVAGYHCEPVKTHVVVTDDNRIFILSVRYGSIIIFKGFQKFILFGIKSLIKRFHHKAGRLVFFSKG